MKARRLKYAQGLNALLVVTTKPIRGTDIEPLDSQPGSGQKPRVGIRVPAQMLVPHEHTYKHDNV